MFNKSMMVEIVNVFSTKYMKLKYNMIVRTTKPLLLVDPTFFYRTTSKRFYILNLIIIIVVLFY